MVTTYACPADERLSCSWEGDPADIRAHFEESHADLLFRTNSVEVDLGVPNENRLLALAGEIYLLQTTIAAPNESLFIRLRYLGSERAAAQTAYDVAVVAANTTYTYAPGSQGCLRPERRGWVVSLAELGARHGRLDSLTCQLLIQRRLPRDQLEPPPPPPPLKLKINNSYVEKHVCDEMEFKYLEAINAVDGRIRELKAAAGDGAIADAVGQLNLLLGEPPPGSRCPSGGGSSLLCSSCGGDMLPPIFVCTNGHNICVCCRTSPCGVCSERVTQFRNTALENVSRAHKHSCRYAGEGCPEKLRYDEVREHEIGCKFCKYKCPNACIFEGKFDSFLKHLKIVHGSVKISESLCNEFPKNYEFFIANRPRGVFHCKSSQFENVISWKALYCGPKERLFFCELYFKGGKLKDPIFLKRNGNVYIYEINVSELKKMKVKEKYAVLNITSYDN